MNFLKMPLFRTIEGLRKRNERSYSKNKAEYKKLEKK